MAKRARHSSSKASKNDTHTGGDAVSRSKARASKSLTGAVLAQSSKASAGARRVERTFAAGVDSALRIARARGVAVTVQERSGKLVSGIPRSRDGVFTIAGESRPQVSKEGKPSPKGAHRQDRKQ